MEKIYDNMRHHFQKQLDSVSRRRSVSSKLDKMYSARTELFHKFSVTEGSLLLSEPEKQLEICIPEILWQIMIEFLSFLNERFSMSDVACKGRLEPTGTSQN